jgi:RNA-splicing ligase RtcB
VFEAFANVRSWASILDGVTRDQAVLTSELPILRAPLALMADAHLGFGATIGSVLVTDDAVIPAAVGVDIGCGMAARQLDLDIGTVNSEHLHRWQSQMSERVPAGLGNWHVDPSVEAQDWMDLHPPSSRLEDVERAIVQLGTLGSGNHFVELSVDEAGAVWLLLHSGSRGPGNRLANIHQRIARELTGSLVPLKADGKPEKDLAWISDDVPAFREYLADLEWSQAYALENRRQLLIRATAALSAAIEDEPEVKDEVNCHHNYAVQEHVVELGRRAYVTRKGAIRAGLDDRGLIPGAMGQASFIVRGLGNPSSYESCSHGAGRSMSRRQARREIPLAEFEASMEGVVWQTIDSEALLDEAPQSYKPIEQVMTDQDDLVSIEHSLRAVANYKGVEERRRP